MSDCCDRCRLPGVVGASGMGVLTLTRYHVADHFHDTLLCGTCAARVQEPESCQRRECPVR